MNKLKHFFDYPKRTAENGVFLSRRHQIKPKLNPNNYSHIKLFVAVMGLFLYLQLKGAALRAVLLRKSLQTTHAVVETFFWGGNRRS